MTAAKRDCNAVVTQRRRRPPCYVRRVTESRRGLIYGVAAYTTWGIAPLYWKLLARVPPAEIIAHRVVWGLLAFIVLVWGAGVVPAVRAAVADRKTLAMMALSGALLATNWGVFVGAVVTGHIVDASLGYFINPLVSIALGMVVLKERPRRLQWLAIGLAVIGVAIWTWRAGGIPWIALVLATTFGSYGLVRKVAHVDSLAGSTIETALLAPLAIGYLALAAVGGHGQLGHATTGVQLLLLSTGVVTAVPLLMFASAARRLPLSTLGFLQFVAPSVQLVIGVIVYGEALTADQVIAFTAFWLGLAVFSADLVRQSRRPARISRTGR
jgi:chloramphenicol-sensitive protein RarD